MDIHFSRRQKIILHELYHANDYRTSIQLAAIAHVSDRTIKTEMRNIMDIAAKDGSFHIVSKRNHGYTIEIDDPNQFETLFQSVEMVQSYALDFENENIYRFMKVARTLIVATAPIKVDTFAQLLYISLSQVHKTLEEVRRFFELHHLSIDPCGNKGLMVNGSEYDRRMVILELYGVHFHRVEIQADPEYLNEVAPDEKRRQDIRHIFLEVLRGSNIRMLDTETQRLSVYLSIVDRRHPTHPLNLPFDWHLTMNHSPEMELANRVFVALKRKLGRFDYDNDEITCFAVELLTREDIDALAYTPYFHPMVHVKVTSICMKVKDELYHRHHLNLFMQDWSYREFEAITTPIVARKVFGDICHERLPFADNSAEICNSPISLTVALAIERLVETNLGMKLERSEILKYAYFVYKVAAYTKFQIKPVNLLLISGNGMNTCRILEKRIRERFGTLIGHTRCMELYEGRGIDMDAYDAALIDMDTFVYNYQLPCRVVHLVKRSHQLDNLYNDLLMKAHQYQWYIPTDEQFTFLEEYPAESVDAFLKNLAFRYTTDLSRVERMVQGWHKYIDLMSLDKSSKGLVLFVDSSLFDQEWIEVISLSNDLTIGKARIKSLMVICIQWNYDDIKLKFWENILKQSTLRDDFFTIIRLGAHGVEKLIQKALEIN